MQRHILPVLGRTSIRQLRYQQIEALYESLLHPETGRGLAPKTVYEIHLIIRGALADAHRRGLVTRNVARCGPSPQTTAAAAHRRPLADGRGAPPTPAYIHWPPVLPDLLAHRGGSKRTSGACWASSSTVASRAANTEMPYSP